MIAIIDYGLGNSRSISNMLKKIGYDSIITSDLNELSLADILILPGVGAFDTGMTNLNESGITDVINKKVLTDKTPIVGICLGMQLLTKGSEEGKLNGLGYIDAETIKFNPKSNDIRIPHMGWNLVNIEKDTPLFDNMFEENRFYFVHSYYVKCNKKDDILTSTFYDLNFVSSFEHENITGFQFHPEKSHKFGMQLLKNYMELRYAKA